MTAYLAKSTSSHTNVKHDIYLFWESSPVYTRNPVFSLILDFCIVFPSVFQPVSMSMGPVCHHFHYIQMCWFPLLNTCRRYRNWKLESTRLNTTLFHGLWEIPFSEKLERVCNCFLMSSVWKVTKICGNPVRTATQSPRCTFDPSKEKHGVRISTRNGEETLANRRK